MALIERTAYPRFSPRPSAGELARLYTPTLRELDLARRATRGGEAGQLAFLVMLKGFQRLGYFPKDAEVPGVIVAHLRSRLGHGEEVAAAPPPRSRQRYRDAIRAFLGGVLCSGLPHVAPYFVPGGVSVMSIAPHRIHLGARS